MAILDLVKGLEVLICVNGEPLLEYDDDEEAPSIAGSAATKYRASRTVSKYIESQEGKYEVHIKLDHQFVFSSPVLWAAIKIDGEKSVDSLWQKSRHQGSSLWITRGAFIGKPGDVMTDLVNPFTFSKIEITNDDDEVNDRKHLDGVGVITVELFRASGGNPTVYTGTGPSAANVVINSALKVDEKALKGRTKSHSTCFGAAIPQKSNFVESQKLDDEKPMAVFSFKYRDRKALQSLLIIPRTPSPKPETAASDGDDDDSFDLTNLDPKEMKKLKKLYRVIQGNGNAPNVPGTIKRERDEDSNCGNLRKKRKSNEEPEMIDLTASNEER